MMDAPDALAALATHSPSSWVFAPVVTTIPFDAQTILDAQGKPKISLWDPHGPRVLDLNGDGAHDALLPLNGFFNVFRNTAADQDLLSTITDGRNDHDPGEPGFVPTVAITYSHLIDDGDRYISRYDAANDCAYPRVCSVGAERVVSTYTRGGELGADRREQLPAAEGLLRHVRL